MARAPLLRELNPGCNHDVARYLRKLTTSEAVARLRIPRSTLKDLYRRSFDNVTRLTVLSNDWLEVLPQLHPDAATGIPPEDSKELQNWLRKIIGDCPLTPFVWHFSPKDIRAKLGIAPRTLGPILSDGVIPTCYTVMKNEWKKIVPQLHPNLAKGRPIPEKDLQRLNEWLDGIIGTHPLTPFIGHLQHKQVAQPFLGITEAHLSMILNGTYTPSRETVLIHKWREVLIKLHPCTAKAEPIPPEDMEKLEAWLDGIIGSHVLQRFLGHLAPAQKSELLGTSESTINNIVAGKLPSMYLVGANDWRNKLLKEHPGATVKDVTDLDAWLVRCWNQDRTRYAGRELWRKAVGEVFTKLRDATRCQSVDEFLMGWQPSTPAEKFLKSIYPRFEAGTYGVKSNVRDELNTYLQVARQVCGLAGLTGAKAADLERLSVQDAFKYPQQRYFYDVYCRLLALMPPLTRAGGGLPVYPTSYTSPTPNGRAHPS